MSGVSEVFQWLTLQVGHRHREAPGHLHLRPGQGSCRAAELGQHRQLGGRLKRPRGRQEDTTCVRCGVWTLEFRCGCAPYLEQGRRRTSEAELYRGPRKKVLSLYINLEIFDKKYAPAYQICVSVTLCYTCFDFFFSVEGQKVVCHRMLRSRRNRVPGIQAAKLKFAKETTLELTRASLTVSF